MRIGTMVLMLLVSCLSSGCSETTKKLDPGRCEKNMDCHAGEKCERTFCEDIYHPRSTIKNY